MTPTLQALCARVASQVSRKAARRFPWLSADDATQEAWSGMLQALETVDKAAPDLGGVLWTAADTAVKRLAWRLGAVATTSRSKAGEVRLQRERAVTEEALQDLPADNASPETLLAREQLALMLARHMAQGREGDAVRAVLLAGMDSRDAAQAYGLNVRTVYYQTRLTKGRILRDKAIRKEVLS